MFGFCDNGGGFQIFIDNFYNFSVSLNKHPHNVHNSVFSLYVLFLQLGTKIRSWNCLLQDSLSGELMGEPRQEKVIQRLGRQEFHLQNHIIFLSPRTLSDENK